MKLELTQQIFEKNSQFLKNPNIKLDGNPSIWIRVIPRGQTDGQTVITKLIVAFPNFTDAPTITLTFPCICLNNFKFFERRKYIYIYILNIYLPPLWAVLLPVAAALLATLLPATPMLTLVRLVTCINYESCHAVGTALQ